MNSRPLRPERSALPTALYPERKRQQMLPFGCGRRIRTLTMRVRVAGATITQFRIAFTAYRRSALLLYEEGRALSTPFSEKFLCQKAAAQPGRLFLRLQFPLLSATMKKQASRVPECFKRARAGLHCEVYLQNGRIQV